MQKRTILKVLMLCAPALLVLALIGAVDGAVAARTARVVAVPETTVLYAVSRGDFPAAVATFEQLVAARDSQGLEAAGTWGAFVRLSDQNTPVNDQLIEVRIPVEKAAMALSDRLQPGEFGLGTSGVKTIASETQLRSAKPPGDADLGAAFKTIYDTATRNNLSVSGSPTVIFSSAETIPKQCTIDEISAEASVSVAQDAALIKLQQRSARRLTQEGQP